MLKKKKYKKPSSRGWRCGSLVKHLPGKYKVLSSNLNTEKEYSAKDPSSLSEQFV
jgi:hypothetical protein